MLKKYLGALNFFMSASMVWLGGLTGAPIIQPTIEENSVMKSIGYSLLTLIIWAGLLFGGLVLEKQWVIDASLWDVLVIFGWGFLIAPVIAVAFMKIVFPKMSGRIVVQMQHDDKLKAERIKQLKKR